MVRKVGPKECICGHHDCPTCFPGPPTAALKTSKKKLGRMPTSPQDSPVLEAKGSARNIPSIRAGNALKGTAWRINRMPSNITTVVDFQVVIRRRCFKLRQSTVGGSGTNQGTSTEGAVDASNGARAEVPGSDASEAGRYILCEDSEEIGCLGMLRSNIQANLAEIRQKLLTQFPQALPEDFLFVSDEGTVVAQASERGDEALRANDFIWGASNNPVLTLMLPGYLENEQMREHESQEIEFKSIVRTVEKRTCRRKNAGPECCAHSDCLAQSAIKAVGDYLDRGYIGCFLNSGGGTLIIGVEDRDRRVRLHVDDTVGFLAFSDKDLDEVTRIILSKSRKLDPPVDEDLVRVRFVPVFQTSGTARNARVPSAGTCAGGGTPSAAASGDGGVDAPSCPVAPLSQISETRRPYLIQIHIAPGRRGVYFESRLSSIAYCRVEGITQQLPYYVAKARLQEDVARNPAGVVVEGWRCLYREPDLFLEVVRGTREAWRRGAGKTSDEFAGRAWLFERISEILETRRGVCIVGGPGTGKTAAIRQLVCGTPVVVNLTRRKLESICYHFLSPDHDEWSSSTFAVMNLLGQLLQEKRTHGLNRVSDALKEQFLRDHVLQQRLSNRSIAADPFAALRLGIAAALRRVDLEDPKRHLIFCVDGVDVTRTGSKSSSGSFYELLVLAAKCLPPSMRIVVTSHTPLDPEAFLPTDWGTINLDGDGEDGQAVCADMRIYADRRVVQKSDDLEAIMPELCRRARGSFVYLDMALECHARNFLPVGQLTAMPMGLTQDYFSVLFRRRFQQASDEWEELKLHFGMLWVGGHLTVNQLAQIRWKLSPHCEVPQPLCQATESVLRSGLQAVRLYLYDSSNVQACEGDAAIEVDEPIRYGLHEEIGRWLSNPAQSGTFALDLERAHADLAAFLLRKAKLGPFDKALQESLGRDVQRRPEPALPPLHRTTSEATPGLAVEVSTSAMGDTSVPLSSEEAYSLAVHLTESAGSGPTLSRAIHLWLNHVSASVADGRGGDRETPLHLAVRRGGGEAVRLLLAVKANPRVRSRAGLTTVEVAARKGLEEIVRSLFEIGREADDSEDEELASPEALAFAAVGGHTSCCQLLLRIAGPELVLRELPWSAEGDSTRSDSSAGSTPLEVAASAAIGRPQCEAAATVLFEAIENHLHEEELALPPSLSLALNVLEASEATDSQDLDRVGRLLSAAQRAVDAAAQDVVKTPARVKY
eukprot:TRINITY_DN30233_c0_g2_i1.p1 TRINITY_DN30233_c0_g2~~TRINITY_DN30233_c0_g2_i1.p1  ORF type:complete len:1243 (+),score=209.68 TRINITY_DN30233_c0_g2_i1:63-3731(+)